MFNLFFFPIIERITGRKLSTLLADCSGTSERTWRDRLHDGWSPTPEQLAAFDRSAEERGISELRSKGHWSEGEARTIIANSPSNKSNEDLPTAELVYGYSPDRGADYAETIAVASQFDRYCNALLKARNAADLTAARGVLLEASAWLRTFYTGGTGTDEVDRIDRCLREAADLQSLIEHAKPLGDSLLFHVLSCWDLEFCSHYFGGSMIAYPLFALVMPRLAPSLSVVVEGNSIRFLRDGHKPGRKIVETSIARFLDFLSVMISWKKRKTIPAMRPTLSEMAAWTGWDEGKIRKWRNEEHQFHAQHLNWIWENAIAADSIGCRPSLPTPMLVAAYLWSGLLVREAGKVKHWIICIDDYELWWKRNLERLTANGLKFGTTRWPRYLTDQPPGNRSPDSWRSSQSSGLSSQPRDSQ